MIGDTIFGLWVFLVFVGVVVILAVVADWIERSKHDR